MLSAAGPSPEAALEKYQCSYGAIDRFRQDHALGRSHQYEKACSCVCRRVELKYEGNIVTDSESRPNLECQRCRASRPLRGTRGIRAMYALC
jgi:hypothetical protein